MEENCSEVIRKIFHVFRDNNIVIYGTGIAAQKVVAALNDFKIMGILDRSHEEGIFCGHKIIPWNDLANIPNGVLIIASSKKNYKEIYLRIRDKCATYGFQVLGAWGEKFAYYPWAQHCDKEAAKYYKKSKEELKKELQQYDAISFDVFDTLIMRRILNPEDIFEMVDARIRIKKIYITDFKKRRMNADKLCQNGTIFDIYDYLQKETLISDKEKNTILQEEIACEKMSLLPRDDMVEIMHCAMKMGKKVNLISDMYLPIEFMKELLDSLGITGYTQLYISCEYKTRKEEHLYEKYLVDNAGLRCLHIGDNYQADVIKPQEYGIDTYEVKSAYAMLKMSNMHGVSGYTDTFNERVLTGLLISELFNSPFALFDTSGIVTIREWKKFGYIFMAPLVIKYIMDLFSYLKIAEKYDGVLFAARDGYVFQQLYKKIRCRKNELPQSYYFLTSRKAAIRASMESEDMFDILKDYLQYNSCEELMEKYMGISESSPVLPGETPDEFLERNKDLLFKKAARLKKNYEVYLKNQGIQQSGKYLFCEIYSKGTTQYALNHLFDEPLDGFYLMKYSFEKDYGIPIASVYNIGDLERERCMLVLHETLIELFLTSEMPALQEIGEDGEPIYESEQRESKELAALKDVWRGIEECFDSFMNLYIEGTEIRKEFLENVFMYLDSVEYESQCEEIRHMRFFDNLRESWSDADAFIK